MSCKAVCYVETPRGRRTEEGQPSVYGVGLELCEPFLRGYVVGGEGERGVWDEDVEGGGVDELGQRRHLQGIAASGTRSASLDPDRDDSPS